MTKSQNQYWWKKTKTFKLATHVALGFAWLLMIGGIYLAFTYLSLLGYYTATIGAIFAAIPGFVMILVLEAVSMVADLKKDSLLDTLKIEKRSKLITDRYYEKFKKNRQAGRFIGK